jgi:hypothetical protein
MISSLRPRFSCRSAKRSLDRKSQFVREENKAAVGGKKESGVRIQNGETANNESLHNPEPSSVTPDSHSRFLIPRVQLVNLHFFDFDFLSRHPVALVVVEILLPQTD